MPGRLRAHRCSETLLDSSAESGGGRAARAGSCRIYLLRSVHRADAGVAVPLQTSLRTLRAAGGHP